RLEDEDGEEIGGLTTVVCVKPYGEDWDEIILSHKIADLAGNHLDGNGSCTYEADARDNVTIGGNGKE
ncbi:MAG: hypothetical protein JSU92_12885, partial [Deltaproteobacteria bacterium]